MKAKRKRVSKSRKVVTPQNRRRSGKGSKHGFSKGNKDGRKFKKGKSGNPGGRPRSADFCADVRAWLKERDPSRRDHKDRQETLLERLLRDRPEIIAYYAFGKPAETIQGPDGGALAVKWFLDPEAVTGPAPEKV